MITFTLIIRYSNKTIIQIAVSLLLTGGLLQNKKKINKKFKDAVFDITLHETVVSDRKAKQST